MKILRPGIEHVIAHDLGLLEAAILPGGSCGPKVVVAQAPRSRREFD